MVLERHRSPEIRHVLLDLDETLYSNPAVVASMIHEIERTHMLHSQSPITDACPTTDISLSGFMQKKLGLSPEEATRLRSEYHDKYGTTITGLVVSDPHNAIVWVS